MNTVDFLLIIHLVTAVICIFPLIGIVSYFAGTNYQRRLQTLNKNSNKKKVNFFY
jgi:spore coat protein CotH